MEFLNTVLALIVTLGILVTIHEYGHFWVARRCGVKVLRFSVGFGKPLITWRDKHDTEFAIAMIPLGGYVAMLDEREGDVAPELLNQTFNRKPVLQRIAVVAAGPVVNLLFAVLVYWVMYVSGIERVVPVVGSVEPHSIAEQAGLESGHEILAIAGKDVSSWDEANLMLARFMGESANVPVVVQFSEQGLRQNLLFRLNDWNFDPEKQSPLQAIGILPWQPKYPAVIGRVVEGGAAEQAGLLPGDKVTGVNEQPIADWSEFVGFIQSHPDAAMMLQISRNGIDQELLIIPGIREQDDGSVIGYIGAGVEPVELPPEMIRQVRYGIFDALPKAVVKTWQMITLTLDSIWKMVEGALSVKNLSGPITIAKVAGASAASGIEAFASFLAYLSISLGILNLLPIPMLDGGHLLYYTVELIRGRPVSEKIQMIGLRIGMAMLFALMGVAIFNDLMRL